KRSYFEATFSQTSAYILSFGTFFLLAPSFLFSDYIKPTILPKRDFYFINIQLSWQDIQKRLH
ncbi:MAG: hypothetical protein ACPG5P_04820, partial [Saprospiraceae bacterium]